MAVDLPLRVLRRVLHRDGRLNVIAEARDGREAIDRTIEARPDIVLLDVRMPGMDGMEALPHVRTAAPNAVIVMLSMLQDPDQVQRALLLGADGFVDKTTEPRQLVDKLIGLMAARPRLDAPSGIVAGF
jgi:DNA-binding NarL/FixJ family response regulator